MTQDQPPVIAGAVVRSDVTDQVAHSVALHNHYGPTEAHVVTAYELTGPPVILVVSSFLNSRAASSAIPSHVLVGGLIPLIVLVVTSAATLIPAARAARVNPVTSLRTE